jgi:hypothetical protein
MHLLLPYELEHTIPPITLRPAHINLGLWCGRVAQVAVAATIYDLTSGRPTYSG